MIKAVHVDPTNFTIRLHQMNQSMDPAAIADVLSSRPPLQGIVADFHRFSHEHLHFWENFMEFPHEIPPLDAKDPPIAAIGTCPIEAQEALDAAAEGQLHLWVPHVVVPETSSARKRCCLQ